MDWLFGCVGLPTSDTTHNNNHNTQLKTIRAILPVSARLLGDWSKSAVSAAGWNACVDFELLGMFELQHLYLGFVPERD